MSESEPGNAIQQVAELLNGEQPAEAAAAVVKQGEPADDELGEGGKKALRAERERATAAERRAAELKAKHDEIEAAQLSDLERAQKAAQDAQEDAAKARVDALRFRVAAQYGIAEEDAELFLTGSDAETLTRQATRLKDRTPTTPRPDPTQGAQQAPALNSDGLTQALARAVGATP